MIADTTSQIEFFEMLQFWIYFAFSSIKHTKNNKILQT